MMSDYKKIAEFIIENVGGKDNVADLTHCLTRLRFTLKDDSKANTSALGENKQILTTQFAGGKFQVVIGVDVGDVYDACLELIDLSEKKNDPEPEEKTSLLNRFTALITQIMIPILGGLKISMLMAFMVIFVSLGWITRGDGSFVVMRAIAYSVLTFFPVILGYTAANAFKVNPIVGLALGCILVYPGLDTALTSGEVLYTLFEGTAFAMPVYNNFFGFPILFPKEGYTSTVIPIILVVWFASVVQKFLEKHLPKYLKKYFMEFFVILIGGLAAILIVGPIAVFLNKGIELAIDGLLTMNKFICYLVITLIYQPAIIFGLHWPIITIAINRFASTGFDYLGASLFTANFAHLAVGLAVYLRTKSKKLKAVCVPAMVASLNCIVEPSIYGVTLPVKKRFLFCMIGGAIGGTLIGILDACEFAWVSGITGFVGFINPETGSLRNLWIGLLATALTMVISFILTWVTWNDEVDETEDDVPGRQAALQNKEIIYSAFSGPVKPLSEMKDKAFVNIGKGVCVVPTSGKVTAPCSGQISILSDDGHAFCIKSDRGAEVLVHIGTDSVNCGPNIFKAKVKKGDHVKAGDVIVKFNMKDVKDLNMESAIIVANKDDYLEVLETKNETVSCGEELMVAISPEMHLQLEGSFA